VFERAVAAGPEHPGILGSYATVLSDRDPERARELFERAVAAGPDHTGVLGGYAHLLRERDPERAQQLFERAVAADPDHAHNLGGYAYFLQRRDPDRSQHLYERALAADPDGAINLGNYAGFLLARGEARGRELAERALEKADPEAGAPLILEVHFYLYANGPADERQANLAATKTLIERGVRSPGWDFSLTLDRAAVQDLPDLDRARQLADVILDEQPVEVLAEWPAWRDAAG
jgi:Tfp pilus assembly protein PilF